MSGPKIIGVAGASASGKTTFCTTMVEKLAKKGIKAYSIGMDQFYKSKPADIDPAEWNWDDPANIDNDEICRILDALREGLADPSSFGFKTTINGIWAPDHDYANFCRIEMGKLIPPADVYFFEGIFALHDEKIRSRFDLAIYINCDENVLLQRRIERDMKERGRTLEYIMENYNKFVLPAYHKYIKESAKWASWCFGTFSPLDLA